MPDVRSLPALRSSRSTGIRSGSVGAGPLPYVIEVWTALLVPIASVQSHE